MKFGCDVSFWQGKVNYPLMKSRGVEFVILKAAHGLKVSDWFSENWTAAKEAGLLRGAYQWFLPAQNPTKQAELLLSLAPDAEVGLWLDLEYNSGDGVSNKPVVGKYLLQVTEWLKRLSSQDAGIYTRAEFFTQYVPQPNRLYATYETWWDLSLYPLWVANYSADARKRLPAPTIPLPWHDWKIWQYSADKPSNGAGHYYGVESVPLDLDLMQ